MYNIFDQIKIRTLIIIYFIIIMVFAITRVDTKFDDQIAYLLHNMILILWFGWVLIYNAKISDVYKDFSQKIVAEKKTLLALIILMPLLGIGCAELLSYIIYQNDPEFFKKLVTEVLSTHKTSSSLSAICFNLNVSIIGPIVEEIMFRGIILNRLSKRWGFNVGIIISSLLFGIQHLEMAIIGAFLWGIVMSLLYLKTNNIMIPITLHIINNSLVTIITTQMPASEFDLNNLIISNNDLIIGVSLFLPSLFYIVRYIKQNWPSKTIEVAIVD